jgi:hypothetical protein
MSGHPYRALWFAVMAVFALLPATNELRPGAPTGTPQAQLQVREGSGPLPPGCSPDQVAALVARFLDAFNRGDRAALAGFFPEGARAGGPADPGFQWYSVTDAGGHFVARDPAELPAYFAARHARHERLVLLGLELRRSWHAGVDVAFDLERQADDYPRRVVGGKGAIDCEEQRIIAWSMGDQAVLDDAGSPVPSPTSGHGA